MANLVIYKDKQFNIGDTVSISYKIKEDNKERTQLFKGILIKVKGNDKNTKMITVRKISKLGVGVERIFPLNSPYISDIKLVKKTSYRKAKAYFIKDLSESETRKKLYREKNRQKTNKK